MRRIRSWALVGLVVGVLLTFALGAVAAAQQQFGTLRGRVVDAETGELVPRARLRLTAYGMTAVADDAGVYVFTGVPVGATTLIVSAPGYRDYTQNVQVFGGDQTLDVLLTPVGTRAPTQRGAPELAPMVESLLSDYRRSDGHFTLGLDLLTIGAIWRDGALGYPRTAFGANALLGVTWRRYRLPSEGEVRAAAEQVVRYRLSPAVSWRQFREEVRDTLNRRWFSYFGINTVVLVVPALEWGWSYDMAGIDGSGLQVNLSLVWGLWTSLIPLPSLGLAYSF